MIKPFHNLHLKLLSLLAAIVLWFFVVAIENTVYLFPDLLEIQPINIDKNVSVASTLPPVKLYLKVEKEALKTLTKADFEISVDLSDLAAGEYQIPLSATSKNPQVTILKIEPEKLQVKLSPVVEKEVEVMAGYRGTPKNGYKVGEVKSEITKVTLAGPQNLLDLLTSIPVDIVLDGTENADIQQTVTLSIPESFNIPKESITITPDQINITATITQEIGQKTVKINPNITNIADATIFASNLVVNPSTVTLQGDQEVLQAITSLQSQPIDGQSLLKRTVPTTMELILPPNVTLLDPNQQVTIFLTSQSQEQKSILAPIIFTKENSNFTVKKVTPPEIRVTAIGNDSLVKNLQNGDITVNINLQNVQQGGPLLINTKDIITPQGVEIIDYQPTQVTLEVNE